MVSMLFYDIIYGHLGYGSNREYGEQGTNVRVGVYVLYTCKHESRTWTPSLENWGRWVKDLFWLANSPHTSNVTDSHAKSTTHSTVLK